MNGSNSTEGWVPQPQGRGTLDIVWSSLFTIFLCCWTSVCVNIPYKEETKWARFRDKLKIASIGILGPEFLIILSVGQWESARGSYRKFRKAGYTEWTMKHAFYADMGGFILEAPDSPPFPLNGEQLYYLVDKKFLTLPPYDVSQIDDTNKSDRLARSITILQALFFCLNTAARAAQHLAITTLEITAVAFVFAMIFTSFFWYHKPQDIGTAQLIRTNTPISEILYKESIDVNQEFDRTPFDFISSDEWVVTIFWEAYKEILRKMRLIQQRTIHRPIRRIESDNFPTPSNSIEILTGLFMILYSAIFLAPWNFTFPSSAEHIIWKVMSVATVIYAGIGGAISLAIDHMYSRNRGSRQLYIQRQTRRITSTSNNKVKRVASIFLQFFFDESIVYGIPYGVLILCTIFHAIYCAARAYILVEDVIGLRSLPPSTFDTVTWSQYIPHL